MEGKRVERSGGKRSERLHNSTSRTGEKSCLCLIHIETPDFPPGKSNEHLLFPGGTTAQSTTSGTPGLCSGTEGGPGDLIYPRHVLGVFPCVRRGLGKGCCLARGCIRTSSSPQTFAKFLAELSLCDLPEDALKLCAIFWALHRVHLKFCIQMLFAGSTS